jgi:hypothetical protein
MNTIAKAAFAIFLIGSVAHGQTQHDLTVKVSDDTGLPLSGAQATIRFLKIGGEDVYSGLTDENGEFSARTEMSLGTFLRVEKTGHYSAKLNNTGDFQIPRGTATVPLVLPRVMKPIALHAARISSIRIPERDTWLGFDLAAADWVLPHGEGRVVDIRFKLSNEFVGYEEAFGDIEKEQSLVRSIKGKRGETFSEEEFRLSAGKWRGVLEVSFPGPKEGVVEEGARYWYYNELRLPHVAPEGGYKSGLRYEASTYEARAPARLIGYYLRTRVKLDANGKIISANYAKIYEDIRFDPRGTLSFWYYYNPTPNDRNLEFDPKRNLFPQTMKGANIANP